MLLDFIKQNMDRRIFTTKMVAQLIFLLFAIAMFDPVFLFTLPEDEVFASTSNSACFGTHTHLRASCPVDTVIAIDSVKVGAKPLSLNCPATVLDTDPVDINCCLPDLLDDCIFDYSYYTSGLHYLYHTRCSGYTQCTSASPVSNAVTTCTDLTLLGLTNYMFYSYACINESRIFPIASGSFTTDSDLPLYLESQEYPGPLATGNELVTCDITSNGSLVDMYILDMRLAEENGTCVQILEVSSSGVTYTWDCDSNTYFNVTSISLGSEVTLKLESNATVASGYLFLGFDAGAGLSIGCSNQTEMASTTTSFASTTSVSNGTSNYTSVSAMSITPTTSSSVTYASMLQTSAKPTTTDSFPLWAIVTTACGSLLVLALVIVIVRTCSSSNEKRQREGVVINVGPASNKIGPNEDSMSEERVARPNEQNQEDNIELV